jgi:hypothetical protein
MIHHDAGTGRSSSCLWREWRVADISVVDDSEEVIGEDVPVFTRQTA